MLASLLNKTILDRFSSIRDLMWKSIPNGVYCFNYHRIGDPNETQFDPNVFSCTEAIFKQHLLFLKENFEIISIEELHSLYKREYVDKKYAVITFDDGYLDNYQLAFPILKKYQVPACLFIATDFIDQKCIPWWDETAWYINKLTLDELSQCDWISIPTIKNLPINKRIRAILRVMKQDKDCSINSKLNELRGIVKEKLDISQSEFDNILKKKNANFRNFRTYYQLFKYFKYPIKVLATLNLIPKLLYLRYFG